jgi:hypothetical protein
MEIQNIRLNSQSVPPTYRLRTCMNLAYKLASKEGNAVGQKERREIMEQSESLGSLSLRAKPGRVLEANKEVAL